MEAGANARRVFWNSAKSTTQSFHTKLKGDPCDLDDQVLGVPHVLVTVRAAAGSGTAKPRAFRGSCALRSSWLRWLREGKFFELASTQWEYWLLSEMQGRQNELGLRFTSAHRLR